MAQFRRKMTPLQRAKQFMPFAALKGFEERLTQVAHCSEERKELSEDQLYTLDQIYQTLSVGEEVVINYYDRQQYTQVRGKIDKVGGHRKSLVVNGLEINFSNIIDIKQGIY